MGGENACVNRVAEVVDEYLENSFREIPAVVALMPHRLFEPQDKEGLQAPLSTNSEERGLKC